ncbi:hypothetical protein DLD82_10405 [Methanospirillum stamsii]|uniref:Uncharacterized protein n=1 Tax=Methanospirillum stamsii TaxID=1277351 RepID=A0A2V2N1H0_9EURY|nr:hypothetical protein DLD82_10405 [Methanospirillum stamsii]
MIQPDKKKVFIKKSGRIIRINIKPGKGRIIDQSREFLRDFVSFPWEGMPYQACPFKEKDDLQSIGMTIRSY